MSFLFTYYISERKSQGVKNMKTFDEMIEFKDKYVKSKSERKYHERVEFLKYVQKAILLILKNDEKEIASYIKQTPSNMMRIIFGEGDCEFHCVISIDKNDKLCVPAFYFTSEKSNECIFIKPDKAQVDEIFELSEYDFIFIRQYFSRHISGILNSYGVIANVINSFNKALFSNFKTHFKAFINECKFSSSEYAIHIPDEKACEELKEGILNLFLEYIDILKNYES